MNLAVSEFDCDVVVVGAGVCGLTAALALERSGYRVDVCEKRSDSNQPGAAIDLERARRYMERINDGFPVDPDRLPAELARAEAITNRYWGLKERNVLIDTHTLQYLAALGVDVSDLRHLENMTIESMGGAFSVSIDLCLRNIDPEFEGLEVDRVILQRDFNAQPTLGELERRLRSRIQHCMNIRMLFDHRAVGIQESADYVEVTFSNGVIKRARYAIVADGGAASSLARGEVADKTVYAQEPVSVAIFRAEPGTSILGYDPARAFTHTVFKTTGWIGVFCNARNVTVAVSDPHPLDPRRSEAVRQVRELGYFAPLVEPPFKVSAEIAIATRFVTGKRTLLAGDAAMTGNPRFGLGVQFGALWAQHLARLFELAAEIGAEPDLAAYETFGRLISQQRKDFELPWLATIKDFTNHEWSFSDPDTISSILSGTKGLSLDMDANANTIHIRTTMQFEFENLIENPKQPMVGVLRSFKNVSFNCDLQIEYHSEGDAGVQLQGVAELSTKHVIEVTLGANSWTIDRGQMLVTRHHDGWALTLRNAEACQETHGKPRHRVSRMPLENLTLRLPDELMDNLIGFDASSVAAAPLYDVPLSLIFDIAEGSDLAWGAYHVRAGPHTRLRMMISRRLSGQPRFTIDVLSGTLTPISFSRFARRSGLSSVRWIHSFSQMTGGIFDTAVDELARLAAGVVRRIEFDLAYDGGGIVTMSSIVPVSVYLPAGDVTMLQRTLLSSSALSGLIAQSTKFVRAVRTE